MNQPIMFSSGLELGNFMVGSGLLHHSWAKIVDLQNENHSNDPNLAFSVTHKVYHDTEIGTVIVFVSTHPCTTQHFHEDLVSSEDLKLKFPKFDFIGTKLNPSFSINKTVFDLYASIQDEISSLNQYIDSRPLIITGHSIAGSIGSLFTLHLLENMSLKANKRPLCITFGSPFIGDKGFQRAIWERPTWHSSFLHLVSTQDPVPYLYTGIYEPFGIFLLCSDSGSAFFEEPESVSDLVVKNKRVTTANIGNNENSRVIDYGNVLEKLKLKTIIKGISDLGESEFSALRAGITIQIKEIGEETQANGENDSTIEEIEKRMIGIFDRKRIVFDPKKKLNDMKIHMTYMEWYKKAPASNGGYYDSFKSTRTKSREEIVKRKNILTQYWTKTVKEEEKMPKKDGAFSGVASLYAGTNYRRMVEPLDIAEWYRKGKSDYIATRSEHYKLLEKWVKEDQSSKNDIKLRACSLTEDSCFWAHVEEALIKCKLLGGVRGGSLENSETLVEDLAKFETYVMGLIENYAVSTEIFLKQSSFMKWWENYEKIRGNNYVSSLTDFMRNHRYKEYV